MPHVDDQFRGHVFPGDPRSMLTGAFACQWPTVPAFRYSIRSDDATGLWSGFNGGGALVGQVTSIAEHDNPRWELVSPSPPFEFVVLAKLPSTNELAGYAWGLWWKRLDDPLNILDILPLPTGRCNVDIKFPDWTAGSSFPGSFGLTARAEQVIFDQTEPPP